MIRHVCLLPALFAVSTVSAAVARGAEAWLLDGRRLRGVLEVAAEGFAVRQAVQRSPAR